MVDRVHGVEERIILPLTRARQSLVGVAPARRLHAKEEITHRRSAREGHAEGLRGARNAVVALAALRIGAVLWRPEGYDLRALPIRAANRGEVLLVVIGRDRNPRREECSGAHLYRRRWR